MTREELKAHCERQVQQFERVEKIIPVTPNDWKRYEEHKLILELLEQEPKTGHWIMTSDYFTTAYGSVDYVKCSCCGEDSLEEGDFCPNCGAKMQEV